MLTLAAKESNTWLSGHLKKPKFNSIWGFTTLIWLLFLRGVPGLQAETELRKKKPLSSSTSQPFDLLL
ncbi:CLUMA_CG008806, isoform A [Clunio marinus]|uniref:CLUMA_CG008806, isoform A n=1 Tax=Clunio marinus TaxID=568069 RepID=A0A1J1I4S6_9DIPT|nr:CLUMA_CG008806, isoform A [Clunio marinus]